MHISGGHTGTFFVSDQGIVYIIQIGSDTYFLLETQVVIKNCNDLHYRYFCNYQLFNKWDTLCVTQNVFLAWAYLTQSRREINVPECYTI